MKVAVRVRPLNQREIDLSCSTAVQVTGNDIEVRTAEGESRRFAFDQCFQTPRDEKTYESQERVCDEIASDVIAAVSCGYNATVIACGQTGSGKTYTLMGSGDRMHNSNAKSHLVDYGVSQFIGQKLLSLMKLSNAVHQLEISFMEVYNDCVIDLLPIQQDDACVPFARTVLKVRDHPKRGVFVQGLSRRRVTNYTDLVDLISLANSRRSSCDVTWGSGGCRSLSHVVFALYFTQAKYDCGVPNELTSRIYITDLADRQPMYNTRATVEERKKGESINRSLMNLNNVISALADVASSESIRYGTKSRPRRNVHVPYGDSALTLLLKDSIGASSFTVCLAAVSPASCHCTDTINTLKMAATMNAITSRPIINEDQSVTRIKELWRENVELRAVIGDSSNIGRSRMFLPLKQFMECKEKLKRNEEWIRILTSKWITRWLAAVKNERHYYDTVLRWQATEKYRNFSSTDSAFGSDLEADHDSKSPGDDSRKLETDRNVERRKSEYLVISDTKDQNGETHRRYRNEVYLGLVTSTDHDTSGDDSVNRITTEHEQLEKHLQPQQQQQQQQKQQQPADDRRRRRLERDKAVARVSRMKLRQQQQQQLLQLRRRAGSQPNVARRNLTDVVPPPRAVDDMMTANDDGDEITEDGPLEGVTPTKSFAQQSIACVEIESKKKMAKSSTNLGDIEQNESLPLMTQLFGHVADRLGHVRNAVCEVLQHRYDYLTRFPDEFGPDSVNKLSRQIESLQPVITYIEQILESGTAAAADQVKYREKLTHYRRLVTAIHKYIDINRLLSSIDADLRRPAKVYTSLVDDLDRLDAVLSTLDREHPLEKQSLYVLQIEVHVMRQRVLKEIDDAWNELISWQLPPYDDDDDPGLHSDKDGESLATLNLSGVGRRQVEQVGDIAGAWSKVGRLDADVAIFCDRLLNRLIRSVTATDCYGAATFKPLPPSDASRETSAGRRVIVIEDGTGIRKVSVVSGAPKLSSSSSSAAAASGDASCPPELVLEQLEQIFDFLDRTLSGIKISVSPKSVAGISPTMSPKRNSAVADQTVDESLMQKIGELAIARILECVYADCLAKIVENAASETDDEFSKLDRVALLVERFEYSLRHHLKVKTRPSSNVDGGREGAPMVSLVGKVREACERAGAARCGRLLAEAHALIVGEANASIDVVDGHPTSGCVAVCGRLVLGEQPPNVSGLSSIDEFVSKCRDETRTAGYRLPNCRISVNIRDLVCLIYNTLRQSLESSPQSALILHHVVCQIVELFCDLEPFYHRDRLASSPLHAALHHNNCMYLAHHLITVDKMFARRKHSLVTAAADLQRDSSSISRSEPSDSDVLSGSTSSCDVGRLRDLVSAVRRLGNDYFTRHINWHKRRLCELLSPAKGFSCIADDDGHTAEQAVQAVYSQLKSVAASWRNVLPLNAYCRSIGSLLNAVLREIIASVVNVTEYSVDDCQCLQRILSTVVAQVTADDRNALFPPPVRSSEGGFEFTGLESPKPPRKSVVVADGDQLQQPIDEHCPVKVILERCVPAWPKYVELVEFFGLGLAGVAERWADGNGPLAMHVTAPEVARLIEAVFERTARRDAFVQQLRRNPSVHAAAARN